MIWVRYRRIVGLLIIGLTAIASLLVAALSFGLYGYNNEGNALDIKIHSPCFGESKAIIHVSSSIRSKKLNIIDRLWKNNFEDSKEKETQEHDIVTIQLRFLNKQNEVITNRLLESCGRYIDITTNIPMRGCNNVFGEKLRPQETINKTTRNIPVYKYAFPARGIYVAGGRAPSAFISCTSSIPLGEERGFSQMSFMQTVHASGATDKRPHIYLASEVELPLRFDNLQAYESSYSQNIPYKGNTRKIVEWTEFTYRLDGIDVFDRQKRESRVVLKCTDSEMKNFSDFIVFAAAAIFGISISALIELFLAKIKI